MVREVCNNFLKYAQEQQPNWVKGNQAQIA